MKLIKHNNQYSYCDDSMNIIHIGSDSEEYDISDLSEKELAKIQKDPSKGRKYATKKRKYDKIKPINKKG